MLNKNEFRNLVKQLNKEKSNIDFTKEDMKIIDKLKNNKFFISAKTILFYYPLKNEVNILPLINFCLANNKYVALPKTSANKIEFYLLDKNWENNLEKGLFDILEPKKNKRIDNFSFSDLILVPSLALGKDKSRLGHGKGYYDKFLATNTKLYKIGLCRDYVLFEKIPTERCDIFLDEIISSN